jgi:hypothetical protein
MPPASDDVRFAFECPRRWSSLTRTPDPEVRYCGGCAQTVHLVTTASAARRLAVAGRCVALGPAERPSRARRFAAFLRALVHGRAPLPPERIPELPPPPYRGPMKTGMVFVDRDEAPPALGWLVETTGKRRGQIHLCNGVTRIGTEPTGSVIDHPSIAPVHARIIATPDGFLLLAEDGAHVLVDDRPVTRHELVDGDRVTLGDVALIWKAL